MRGDVSWAHEYRGKPPVGLAGLIRIFFDHYAISLYASVACGSFILFLIGSYNLHVLILSFALTAIFYAPVEYVLHRYVLHALFLSRTRWTASVWRRVHFDHHMDPADLSVLFAAPATSVPFLLVLSGAGALVIDRPGDFAAMLCATFTAFIYYEFMHLVAHLPSTALSPWLEKRRRCHLQHHFVDERVGFGIGTGLMDRLVPGSVVPDAQSRSETVRNLGYRGAWVERFPWVQDGWLRKRAATARSDREPL